MSENKTLKATTGISRDTVLKQQIRKLKKEKEAIILAHYYTRPEIQDIADFVGDSLELARKAAQTSAEVIVFAGVHFMAETAKIINPQKKVLIPDLEASCSLAESCQAHDFRDFLDNHPNHQVVTYINSSAAVKTYSDVVCTSSNAEKVVRSIPEDQPIIFAPDKNLGQYVAEKTGRKNMLMWNGQCHAHAGFSEEKIKAQLDQDPKAKFIVHPETQPEIRRLASFVGSTAGMLNYVQEDECEVFIVGTEVGILHEMKKRVPFKKLIPALAEDQNGCNWSTCEYMKMSTLEKLYECLKNESPEVIVEKRLAEKALQPIEKMLAL